MQHNAAVSCSSTVHDTPPVWFIRGDLGSEVTSDKPHLGFLCTVLELTAPKCCTAMLEKEWLKNLLLGVRLHETLLWLTTPCMMAR